MNVTLEFYGPLTVTPEYVGNGTVCIVGGTLSGKEIRSVVWEALRTEVVLTEHILEALDREVLIDWAEKQGLHY